MCRAVSVYELPSMEGTVVILPQIVPALLNHGRRYPLTERYGDPFMWTLSTMRNMLSRFLHASGATCLPSLHEYTQLPDKVWHKSLSNPSARLCTGDARLKPQYFCPHASGSYGVESHRAASITGSLLISDMVCSCMLQCRDDLMGTPCLSLIML